MGKRESIISDRLEKQLLNIFRSLKSDIEELIVKKIKALDDADITPDENEVTKMFLVY